MNDPDNQDDQAGQAAANLSDGLASCRRIMKSYRAMFGEHPIVEPQPDRPATADNQN